MEYKYKKIRYVSVILVYCVMSILLFNVVSAVTIEKTDIGNTARQPQADPGNLISTQSAKPPFAGGEFIVKYKNTVTFPVEQIFAQNKSFAESTSDKSRSLDVLHRTYQVRSATPVFRNPIGAGQPLMVMADLRLSQKNKLQALQRNNRQFANRKILINKLPDLSHVYLVSVAPDIDIEAAVNEFAKDPDVEYAQPNYSVKPQFVPNDPFYSSAGSWGQTEDDLWGLKIINSEQAWDVTQGAGAIVAIVDTGVDFSHPDIAANKWINTGEIPGNNIDDDGNGFIDDINGWNFYDGNNNVNDGFGHGTHVAGTAAAVGNNNIGIIGVAPQAKIMALKGFSDYGAGLTSALSSGIKYAADNGAIAINNSWSCSTQCPYNPIAEDAVRYAYGLGAVVVFSAGNGSGQDVYYYSPQNIGETITVGSSTPLDNRSSFSNVGVDMDVYAPGGGIYSVSVIDSTRNILSLKSQVCNVCQANWIVGNDYLRISGTSMAAPHVTGLAALVASLNPSYSPDQIKQVIRKGADDLGSAGFDAIYGYGRINAFAALNQPTPLNVMISDAVAVFSANTSELQINGLVGGPDFDHWALEYGLGDAPTLWTQIAASTAPVETTSLFYTWDASVVPDGNYSLRLRAWNTAQQEYEDRQKAIIDQVQLSLPSQTEETAFRTGDTVQIMGTARPADFASFSIRIEDSKGNPLPNPNVALVNGGLQPVYSGMLASWDTANINIADHYTIYLDVHLLGGGTTTEATKVVVDPDYHVGWPKSIPKYLYGSGYFAIWHHLTIADVNGDKAIVLGYGHDVNLIDHTGNSLPGWPQTVSNNEFNISPAVGDITGDDSPEVVAITIYQDLVYVWNKDGVLLPGWPKHLGLQSRAANIADINNDGINEIVVIGDDGSVNVVDAQGNSLPGWPQIVEQENVHPWLNTPSTGDVDGDGVNEVIVSVRSKPRNVYVFRGDGTLMAGWPQAVDPDMQTPWREDAIVLGDLDSDGDMEIVMVSENGIVHAFQHDGSYVDGWPKQLIAKTTGATVGDIDNDGKLEILVSSQSVLVNSSYQSYIYALNNDGTEVPGWPVSNSGGRFDPPVIADIDNDGRVEVISSNYRYDNGPYGLIAFNDDGSVVNGFPKPTINFSPDYSMLPAVADIDNDGALELAWMDGLGTNQYRLYLWDLQGAANSKIPWSMYNNGPQLTAANTDSDSDGIENKADNCLERINMAQRDVDGDGYGNVCDPDFNNDGVVNAADLAYIKTNFFSSDPEADLNGDGVVNAADLAILKSMFFGPPGPSGLVGIP